MTKNIKQLQRDLRNHKWLITFLTNAIRHSKAKLASQEYALAKQNIFASELRTEIEIERIASKKRRRA